LGGWHVWHIYGTIQSEHVPSATTGTLVVQEAKPNQAHEVASGGPMGRASELLKIRVGDAAMSLEMRDGLALPVVQLQLSQHPVGQPITPELDYELARALLELGLGQAVGRRLPDHHQDAGAKLLDVTGEEQGLT